MKNIHSKRTPQWPTWPSFFLQMGLTNRFFKAEQGRLHGNTVAVGWAGAVVRKPLGIQKCYGTDGPTDGPKRHGVESSVRD